MDAFTATQYKTAKIHRIEHTPESSKKALLKFAYSSVVQGYVAYLAWDTGDPFRLIYGKDSFGNTCNRNNDAITNVSLSGMDMRGKS